MSRRDIALRHFDAQRELTDLRVKSGIENYRKGNAHIVLLSDRPLPENVTVEVEQINHEFRFGANLFLLDEFGEEEKNAAYREKFAELFNLATVPFYWDGVEPEKGKPRYAKDSPKVYRRPAPDLCVEYCKEKGIEPKCHCLNYDSWIPNWLVNEPVPVIKKYLEKRFREIAERYADDIPSFEVTNETLQTAKSKFILEDDFVEWSFRMADRYFPNNRLIINDYNIWWPYSYNTRTAYYMQIERLLRDGITHLDSIGMQFHSFFPVEREGGDEGNRRYNPRILFKVMDLYARLGKAEQITEMTIPSYTDKIEDEEVQAELLANLYPIFFSHPAMEAVIYWNLVDGYAYTVNGLAGAGDMTQGENTYHGGLLRFDMSEKPAFTVLKNLIRHEWHTSATVKAEKTDKAEKNLVQFRGFYGDYKLTVHTGEKTVPVDFKLSKDNFGKLIVRL